jgi:hypothetical protein
MMTNLEIIERIKALLLNKVENLDWFYFNIHLNSITPERQMLIQSQPDEVKMKVNALLNQIEISGFEYDYTYTGNEGVDSQMLYDIMIYVRLFPAIQEGVIKRIFDINEVLSSATVIEARNSASADLLGQLNGLETKWRSAFFDKKIRNNFRSEADKYVILAEGDSWFQFPKAVAKWHFLGVYFTKDIIRQLMDADNLAISTIAAGGDWLANMLDNQSQQYIDKLSTIQPDVFLISGGGNDLVTDKRLAIMVRNFHNEGKRTFLDDPANTEMHQDASIFDRNISALLLARQKYMGAEEFERYKEGLSLLSNDFFRFLNICLIQYFTLFYKLLKTTNKFSNMLILTHGYDFPIPSNRGDWKDFSLSGRWIENHFLGNGKWLHEALALRGITDTSIQRNILFTIIYEFNEMMEGIARYGEFNNVFHIDCRGVATKDTDWIDELHLKEAPFAKIAAVFKQTIEERVPQLRAGNTKFNVTEKIIKVRP